MLNKEEVKSKLKELVDRFASASKNKDYVNGQNEEWVKWNYIEPLLEMLGWKKQDIEKEARILKGRADYILKVGNEELAVVEAKKVGTTLTEDEGRQAVSYAYHRNIKFAILTNFKEIRVYHALTNIKTIDKNLLKLKEGSYFRLNFDQFLDRLDELLLLSKDSFENKEINKLLSKKDERLAKPIDKSILEDLLQFREWLSKDLKKVRTQLTEPDIDEIVQILIDRLIFMRSVEDRGLEPKNFLLGMVGDFQAGRTDKRLWELLKQQFKIFNKQYDSKLFEEGLLEKEGFFDEQTLTKVIKGLYFGTVDFQQRYQFDEIPGDLLGNIYEQYLGTILQGTEKRVKLEEKSGKRKKMGIYYTPSYIVDYIVKNTVGGYIKDKNIDEILDVKIVDPACGSGSFIVRAFQEVCAVIEKKLKAGEKAKSSQFQFYKENRLSLGQKASILTNCIYGVDLDEKAVELAQLNLLLKILEDETPDTHKHLLPNLRNNVKCGNSLIDDPKIAGDKAFKWEAQFPEVFKHEGFDVVIGNPPYVNIFNISEPDRSYFQENYGTATNKSDLYSFFIEKVIKNLLRDDGYLGFIVSNTWTSIQSFENLRKLLLSNTTIKSLVPLELGTFSDATVVPIIMLCIKDIKNIEKNKIKILDIKKGEFLQINEIAQQELLENKGYVFSMSRNKDSNSIFEKLKHKTINLGDIVKFSLGIKTADNEKFVSLSRKDSLSKKVLKGKYISRYYVDYHDEWLQYNPKEMMKKKGAGPRKAENFEVSEKIILQEISGDKIIAALDKEKYFCLDTCNILYEVELGYNMRFILGLLNSRLIGFWYGSQFKGLHVKLNELRILPIKKPDHKQEIKIVSLVDQMLELRKKLHAEKSNGSAKERLEQQIKNIDYEIDQEVYKLYGITKEEQKIIEESLK